MSIQTVSQPSHSVEPLLPSVQRAAPAPVLLPAQRLGGRFAIGLIGAVAAAAGISAVVSRDPAACGVAGFTFLVGLASALAAFALLLVITGGTWAPPLARQVIPVSFPALILGLMLCVPAVLAANTFHRPEGPWFASSLLAVRTVAGLALLLGFAWLACRYPKGAVGPGFLISFILVQSLLSWDFGMTLQPHWHDTVLAPFWIVGSVLGGTALLTLLCSIRARDLKTERNDLDRLGCFLLAFALLHGYVLYAQTLTTWYGNLPVEVGSMHERLQGSYQILFWIVVVDTIAVPILLLIFRPVRCSRWLMTALAFAILAGLWLERLWLVLPARHTPGAH